MIQICVTVAHFILSLVRKTPVAVNNTLIQQLSSLHMECWLENTVFMGCRGMSEIITCPTFMANTEWLFLVQKNPNMIQDGKKKPWYPNFLGKMKYKKQEIINILNVPNKAQPWILMTDHEGSIFHDDLQVVCKNKWVGDWLQWIAWVEVSVPQWNNFKKCPSCNAHIVLTFYILMEHLVFEWQEKQIVW